MKVAASVWSWIGGVMTISIWWLNFSYIPAIAAIFTVITVVVVVFREISVNVFEKKVCVGVLMIIFGGLIGGILTLCIPDHQLHKKQAPSNNMQVNTANSVSNSQTESGGNDKFEVIKKYKELLDNGIITQEEFEEKKKELNI